MIRVGQGYDVHAFEQGRALRLGGVEIPHDRGLAGHSDADVLLHALTDAILGALAWGDIGSWFPDTDEKYRDVDSMQLLTEVWGKVKSEGWNLENADSIVIAQAPKLRPHIDSMRTRIAAAMDISVDRISIKATTTERLGFEGREEGIAASATVLLRQEQSDD